MIIFRKSGPIDQTRIGAVSDQSVHFGNVIKLVLSDLVGVDQLTIVIPTKVGIQLCLSGGSPPTRG